MSINVEAVGRWQSPIRRERGHIYVRCGVQVRMRRQRDTMLLLLYDWTRMRGRGGDSPGSQENQESKHWMSSIMDRRVSE